MEASTSSTAMGPHHLGTGRADGLTDIDSSPQFPSPAPQRRRLLEVSSLISQNCSIHISPTKAKGGKASANLITGLDTWLQAWSLFASVLSSHKPHLAPDLFSYQSFVARSSGKFQSYAWLQYNAPFRLQPGPPRRRCRTPSS